MNATAPAIQLVPVNRIRLPDSSRRADPGLVASVREGGVIQPIAVVESADGFALVYGARRLDAARKCKFASIAATVFPAGTPDIDLRLVRLIENIQRASLAPMQEGDAFRELVALGVPAAELARRIGKPVNYVSARLRLAALPPHVRELLPPKFSVTAVAILCRLPLPLVIRILEQTPSAAVDCDLASEECRKAGRSLRDAAFDSATACAGCSSRDGDTCLRPACFDEKTGRHVGAAIATLRERQRTAPVVVSPDDYDGAPDAFRKLVKAHGGAVLGDSRWAGFREKRLAADGEPGTDAILLRPGGHVEDVRLVDAPRVRDGRAAPRNTALRPLQREEAEAASRLAAHLRAALDGPAPAIGYADLPGLVTALAEAVADRNLDGPGEVYQTLLTCAAPAIRRLFDVKVLGDPIVRKATNGRIRAVLRPFIGTANA